MLSWFILAVLSVLFIGAVVLVVVLIFGRRPGPGDPKTSCCGGCGYNVQGLSQLNCPECGADLRDVGIVTPQQRRRVGPIMGVVLWSVVQLLPGLVISVILMGVAVPHVRQYDSDYDYHHRDKFGGRSSDHEPPKMVVHTLVLNTTGSYNHWQWQPRPNVDPVDTMRINVTTDSGAGAPLHIDLEASLFHYETTESGRVEGTGLPDEDDVAKWLTTITQGADVRGGGDRGDDQRGSHRRPGRLAPCARSALAGYALSVRGNRLFVRQRRVSAPGRCRHYPGPLGAHLAARVLVDLPTPAPQTHADLAPIARTDRPSRRR